MTCPLYRFQMDLPALQADSHRGLWFERLFDRYQDDWTIPEKANQSWLDGISSRTCGDAETISLYARRCLNLVKARGGQGQVFATHWHFATGLGLPHPVENGLAWHPTLGTPYLAGSGVKGLVRAWLTEWAEDEEKRARVDQWCGTLQCAGQLIFFDAIPVDSVRLVTDVMTPHMGDWYAAGDQIQGLDQQPERQPGDWNAPVPIPFLAVREARLLFAVVPRLPRYADQVPAAMEALTEALDLIGAGAKTAAGYGRFTPDPQALEKLKKDTDEEEKSALEQQRQQEHLQSLSPFEQEVETLVAQHGGNQAVHWLLQKLDDGHWSDPEQQVTVARRIRELLKSSKKWKPQYTGKNAKDLRAHQMSLKVQSYLGEDEK